MQNLSEQVDMNNLSDSVQQFASNVDNIKLYQKIVWVTINESGTPTKMHNGYTSALKCSGTSIMEIYIMISSSELKELEDSKFKWVH